MYYYRKPNEQHDIERTTPDQTALEYKKIIVGKKELTMESSDLTNSIILNNRAVNALVRGDLKQANDMLGEAIRDFSQNLDDNDPLQNPTAPGLLLATRGVGVRFVPLHERLCAHDASFCPENDFEIYNHAFSYHVAAVAVAATAVNGDEDGDDPTHHHALPPERSEVACVLLYNFGLVLLKRGILEGKTQTAWMNKSLKIYRMAVSCWQENDILRHREEYNEGLRTLRLAMWVNQGFIHSYYMEYDAVVSCRDNIRDILLVQGNNNDNALPSSPGLIFFLRTIVHMEGFGLPRNVSPAA